MELEALHGGATVGYLSVRNHSRRILSELETSLGTAFADLSFRPVTARHALRAQNEWGNDHTGSVLAWCGSGSDLYSNAVDWCTPMSSRIKLAYIPLFGVHRDRILIARPRGNCWLHGFFTLLTKNVIDTLTKRCNLQVRNPWNI